MSRTADIRVDILVYLYAARPVPRTVENILQASRRNGQVRDVQSVEIERELSYLEGRELCTSKRRELDQKTSEWEISAKGIDHAEREGLV